MILEITIALLLGVISGTLTGLTPGIHTNLIAILFLPLSARFSPTTFILFLVSMAITHTFLDFIPSIYLGAPDEDTALGVMPGHKFLLKGNGNKAVLLTLIGSSSSILLLLLIIPLFILFVPIIYPFIEKMIGFILIWISFFLIYSEKNLKLQSFIIFILAGFLGIASLNLNTPQPLLPLLTGLFGSSTLIYSISKNTIIPQQKIEKFKIKIKQIIKPSIATAIVSPIFSFLPGLGSSQAAIVSSQIIKQSKEQFLILLGSINTLVMSVSFLTLYLTGKTRTGTAAAISQITSITSEQLVIIFLAVFCSSIISIFLTIKISKWFAKNIHKFNYSKISILIILLLIIIIFIFSGFLGIFILIASTILGLTCTYFKVRKGFLMGSLLIPTILFYLPF